MRLPRLRSLEGLVWGMMMFIIVGMMYSLNELHATYQHYQYSAIDPTQHGRQIRGVEVVTDSPNVSGLYDTYDDGKETKQLKDKTENQRGSDIKHLIIYPGEENPSDHHAEMLEEIDGFNYFVEWEDPYLNHNEQKTNKQNGVLLKPVIYSNDRHELRDNKLQASNTNEKSYTSNINSNKNKFKKKNQVGVKSVVKPPVVFGKDTHNTPPHVNTFNFNNQPEATAKPRVPVNNVLSNDMQQGIKNVIDNAQSRSVKNSEAQWNNTAGGQNHANVNQGQSLPLIDNDSDFPYSPHNNAPDFQGNNFQNNQAGNREAVPSAADNKYVASGVEIIKPLPLSQSNWTLQQLQHHYALSHITNGSSGSMHARSRYHDNMQGVMPSELKSVTLPKVQRRVYVEMIGRLGNNMFQFASLYGITRSTRRIPALPLVDNQLLNVFHLDIMKYAEFSNIPPNMTVLYEENSGIHTPKLSYLPPRDVILCCYLQSWKYFRDYNKELKSIFRFKDWITTRATHLLHTVTWNYLTIKHQAQYGQHRLTYVGVHVRRSDYMLQSHIQRGYKPATLSYLHKAMDYFRQKYPNVYFIVCSDEIDWCKKHISQEDVYFVEHQQGAMLDLAILSQCNHTVITVGSFGWWAGFLSGGDVVYYKDWPKPGTEIGRSYKHDDYFPPHWKGIGG